MTILAALLALSAPSTVLDFGPKVASIPELCRAYLPEGERLTTSAEMDNRFVVAHLKGKTWEEVQQMLETGMGIQAVKDSSGWHLQVESARRDAEQKQTARALSGVANAVQKEAADLLAGTNPNQYAGLDIEAEQIKIALEGKAPAFRPSDWEQFYKETPEAQRLAQIKRISMADRWLTARYLAQNGKAVVNALKVSTITNQLPAFYRWGGLTQETYTSTGMRLDPVTKADGMALYQTGFDWLSLTPIMRVNLLLPPKGEEPGFLDLDGEDLFQMFEPIQALLKEWPQNDDPWTGVAQVSQADAGFKIAPRTRTLHALLTAWAEQTGGQMLVEVHPFSDLVSDSVNWEPQTSLKSLLAAWDNPGPIEERGMLKMFRQENRPMDSATVSLLVEESIHTREDQRRANARRLYRDMDWKAHEGILLGTPRLRPLWQRLGLKTAAYWPISGTDGAPIASLQAFYANAKPEEIARWRQLSPSQAEFRLGQFGSYATLHPILHSLYEQDRDGFQQIWKSDFSGSYALSASTTEQAWQEALLADSSIAHLIPSGGLRLQVASGPTSKNVYALFTIPKLISPPFATSTLNFQP